MSLERRIEKLERQDHGARVCAFRTDDAMMVRLAGTDTWMALRTFEREHPQGVIVHIVYEDRGGNQQASVSGAVTR